jgi:hypothetical protein
VPPEGWTATQCIGGSAPIADLHALAPERGSSTLSGHWNRIPFAVVMEMQRHVETERLGGFQIDASSSFD